MNDTVGTLMAHSYRHPESFMGIILGTGTNAGKITCTQAVCPTKV